MPPVSRRTMIAGAAALGATTTAARAQLVYTRSDWKREEFDRLVHASGRIRQVYDVTAINEGRFLNNIKNSLNGFEFGFGVAPDQIRIVAALHGAANMVNYDDSMWEKYRLGEWLKVIDPDTNQPAAKNIFYPSKLPKTASSAAGNPSDEHSSFQDHSVEGLQRRGIHFLSCHTATEEQAKMIVKRLQLQTAPEDVVKDLQAHALPGVLIVPSMVASVALLQIDGHYSYITV